MTIGMTMAGNLRAGAPRADVQSPRHRPPRWAFATRPTGFVVAALDDRLGVGRGPRSPAPALALLTVIVLWELVVAGLLLSHGASS